MKTFMAAFLCVLMCASFCSCSSSENSRDISLETSLSPGALTANARDINFETVLALRLEELGLLPGVGENEDGTTDFELNRAPNRVEALTMLICALGKGAEAEAYPKTHPFRDVPAWADGYVSYAYDNGLTNGLSDTLFGAESVATIEMYLTYVLRALGYSDGNKGELTWDAPWALAAWCGILPIQVDRTDFLRADVMNVTCAALYAGIKGTQTTLHEQLVSEGAFTKEQFETAFADDPFADFRLIDSRVSNAIAEHGTLGLFGDNVENVYATECHIITDIVGTGDVLTVSALVYYRNSKMNEDNTIVDYVGMIDIWLIELDAKTLDCQSCGTAVEFFGEGLSLTQYFSEETLAARYSLSTGMAEVCKMETQMQIDSGLIGYRQPTYEEALAHLTASAHFGVVQTLETEPCMVLLGVLRGTPHGSTYSLNLIYKPGSSKGEGVIVSLPLPADHPWGLTRSKPDNLRLSEDCLTLYYSHYFEEHLMTKDGSERILHEAGTYNYTVDLNTGETLLDFLADS